MKIFNFNESSKSREIFGEFYYLVEKFTVAAPGIFREGTPRPVKGYKAPPQGVREANCELISYADDFKMLAPRNNCLKTQEDLAQVVKWGKENRQIVNGKKSVVVRFGDSINASCYEIDGVPLEQTEKTKDLGILIDNKLNFKGHMHEIILKAYSLINRILSFSFDDPSFRLKLYTTYVRPKLEYACALWDPTQQLYISKFENVQKYFLKKTFRGVAISDDKNIPIFWLELVYPPCVHVEYTWGYLLFLMLHARIDLPLPVDVAPSKTRGPEQKIRIPHYNTRVGKASFFLKFGKYWNALPGEVGNVNSLAVFKRKLREVDLLSIV